MLLTLCCHRLRHDDLTLVTMRKPGELLTWDDVNFKPVPDYNDVPQCAAQLYSSSGSPYHCCLDVPPRQEGMFIACARLATAPTCNANHPAWLASFMTAMLRCRRHHLLDHLSRDRRVWADIEGHCAKTLLLGRTVSMRFCTGK